MVLDGRPRTGLALRDRWHNLALRLPPPRRDDGLLAWARWLGAVGVICLSVVVPSIYNAVDFLGNVEFAFAKVPLVGAFVTALASSASGLLAWLWNWPGSPLL